MGCVWVGRWVVWIGQVGGWAVSRSGGSMGCA